MSTAWAPICWRPRRSTALPGERLSPEGARTRMGRTPGPPGLLNSQQGDRTSSSIPAPMEPSALSSPWNAPLSQSVCFQGFPSPKDLRRNSPIPLLFSWSAARRACPSCCLSVTPVFSRHCVQSLQNKTHACASAFICLRFRSLHKPPWGGEAPGLIKPPARRRLSSANPGRRRACPSSIVGSKDGESWPLTSPARWVRRLSDTPDPSPRGPRDNSTWWPSESAPEPSA